VIEQGLERTRGVDNFEYGCDARPAFFTSTNDVVLRARLQTKSFTILKPHGSINWLYCDGCREVFWFQAERRNSATSADSEGSKGPKNQIERISRTLLRERDWKIILDPTQDSSETLHPPKTIDPACPVCGSHALGTRLATFSYRKALDFSLHEATWRRAEALLREADNWIFFGYSMPGADFEFKHLLKRVELSRLKKPHVILVTGGSGAASTRKTYEDFFGSSPSDLRTYHKHGLTSTVIEDLTRIGALQPTSK
jgi:hypothetical protein